MFRSPHELDAHVRYQSERLASELQRCVQIDRTGARSPRLATLVRRRVGIGLMRVGAVVAGGDAPRGLPARPVWPELANR